jgi:hypothetical protein
MESNQSELRPTVKLQSCSPEHVFRSAEEGRNPQQVPNISFSETSTPQTRPGTSSGRDISLDTFPAKTRPPNGGYQHPSRKIVLQNQ